jgi:hypothetical protein
MLLAPQILLATFVVVFSLAFFFIVVPEILRAIGVRTNVGVSGFLFGFLLATFLAALVFLAATFTGAGQYLSGAMAERWTGRELRKLGPSWQIFHGVPFDYGFAPKSPEIDVDHTAVGPYGVLVVETKYISRIPDLNEAKFPTRIRDAMSQVEHNAGHVRALLSRDAPGVPVRPVVVIWGRLVTVPKNAVRSVDCRPQSIRIVHGAEGENWRPLLRVREGSGITPEAIEVVSTKIENYVAERESSRKSGEGKSLSAF